jgi:hypothetical protein
MKQGCLAWLFVSLVARAAAAQGLPSPGPLPQVPVPVGASPALPAVPALPPAPVPPLLPPPAPVGNAPATYQPPPAPPGGEILVPDANFGPAWRVTGDGDRLWLQADFLLWFVKDGPLHVPLATRGSTADADPGALGQPHTRVLFGDSDLDYGAVPGGRLEIGYWFGGDCRFGIEGGFFLLSQADKWFSVFSNDTGSPVLSVPIVNAQTRREDQVPVAFPGVFAGGVLVHSSSTLDGANLDGSFSLVRDRGCHAELLAGFRFLDLRERLDVQTPDVSIDGAAAGTAYNTVDEFRTSNQFYGGRLGGRLGFCGDRWSMDLDASVALGSTYQRVTIDGFSTVAGPSGSPTVAPGGIFAQPTNMGRYWAWDFTVVPEVGLKAGYRVWRNLRLTAGYDFLYWSSVVRPGSQFNREVNLSQSSLLGGGTLAGPAQPVAPLSRTDFYAQGLSLGMELRW